MGLGQGNILTQQKQAPAAPPGPPGPPFLLTSANNGLSVDPVTGKIVLGQAIGAVGDPAQLLSSREIPMNGNIFQMIDAGNTFFSIDPVLQQISLSNPAVGLFFSQPGNPDLQLYTNTLSLEIDESAQFIHLNSSGNPRLSIDLINNLFTFGDIPVLNNGTYLSINDATQLTQFLKSTQPFLYLDMLNGVCALGDYFGFNNGIGVVADDRNTFKRVDIGDVGIAGNSTTLTVDDLAQLMKFRTGVNTFLSLDVPNADYLIGDIDGIGNSNYIDVYDFGNITQINSGNPNVTLVADGGNQKAQITFAGIALFEADAVNMLYRIGNKTNAGVANGNYIELDDLTGVVNIKNLTNTIGININGVAGFTGTVGPVITTITVNNGIVTNVA